MKVIRELLKAFVGATCQAIIDRRQTAIAIRKTIVRARCPRKGYPAHPRPLAPPLLSSFLPAPPVERTLAATLRRIAGALERLAPPPLSPPPPDLFAADTFLWQAIPRVLEPLAAVNRVPLHLLKGIDQQRTILLDNTYRFARGLPANNALLWGARGAGKSALVKAIHAAVARESPLVLVEIHREDIPTLPCLLGLLTHSSRRCLLFCDDLSFETGDQSYKSLKAVLEGGIQGRPDTVLFYATSNRRHLMARDMFENEQANALMPGETIDEKVSLSDRFGLWLGFYTIDQATYLEIVHSYAQAFALPVIPDQLAAEAIKWTVTRGARSGRVAWQFIQDLAGRLGCHLLPPTGETNIGSGT